jgi:beta-fructofuranosidase
MPAALWFCILCLALCAASAMAGPPNPFADAIAAWHMADLKDSAGASNLTAHGDVKTGIELTGADRIASRARGGDGRVAQFDGGHLDAGQGAGGKLNLAGGAMSLCIRLRDPGGNWMAPLFSKHGGHEKLVYNLFSHDFGQGRVIGFELGTEGTRGMTQVAVPVKLIGPSEWHDIICRYNGATLQLFVDGVWMDEGFPIGALRQGNREPCLIAAESVNGAVKSGWRGMIDHAAIWSRALTDSEIEALSGRADEVQARKTRYLGPTPSMQYFRPHNQFNVGDTLPFFHDGVFHFYYLLDRGHHSAKGGQGAHQWAHASSRDLVHWTEHRLAIPITRETEGSICTGSVFFHAGTYYGFYATRIAGKGEHLSLATSHDGIQFTKAEPDPFLSPGAQYTSGFRDPHVFLDQRTGLFHLLVSTMLKEGKRGCLAHYTSADLKRWAEAEPFLIEGNEVPECPDYFEWNGRYYLLFSHGQVAHYRMSANPLGPWNRPRVDTIDGAAARVMKTAAFTGNRRIGTASIWPQGYAGWPVFRELIQREDGTLGSRFVPEMIPPTGEAVELRLEGPAAAGDSRRIRLQAAEGTAAATLHGMPRNACVRLRVENGAAVVGLRLRSTGENDGHEVRIAMAQRKVSVVGGQSLADVDGLDRPFTLDIILKDSILDVCVGEQRTLVNWVPDLAGDRLVLFVEKGAASFTEISARPLR